MPDPATRPDQRAPAGTAARTDAPPPRLWVATGLLALAELLVVLAATAGTDPFGAAILTGLALGLPAVALAAGHAAGGTGWAARARGWAVGLATLAGAAWWVGGERLTLRQALVAPVVLGAAAVLAGRRRDGDRSGSRAFLVVAVAGALAGAAIGGWHAVQAHERADLREWLALEAAGCAGRVAADAPPGTVVDVIAVEVDECLDGRPHGDGWWCAGSRCGWSGPPLGAESFAVDLERLVAEASGRAGTGGG